MLLVPIIVALVASFQGEAVLKQPIAVKRDARFLKARAILAVALAVVAVRAIAPFFPRFLSHLFFSPFLSVECDIITSYKSYGIKHGRF